MSNPTWQDITPQRTQPPEVECTADPCVDPEHDHEPPAILPVPDAKEIER